MSLIFGNLNSFLRLCFYLKFNFIEDNQIVFKKSLLKLCIFINAKTNDIINIIVIYNVNL